MTRLRGREAAGAAGFFAFASVLFTWPLAARLRSGMPDLWDDKLNAWIFHWDFHQLFRDPLHLFDANIFFPAHDALAFSENLFGAAVFGFPLYAAGMSTLAVANLLMLLGMTLSGLAAWYLARDVTGDSGASLVAGVVYAFVPWRLAQLPHVQFQWGAFLPLLLLFLIRALENGGRRDAGLFGVFFAWNALTNVHYALFSGFLVLLVAAHALLTRDRAEVMPRLRAAALAGLVAGLAVLPFYLPYARASREYGMVRGEGEIASFSGRPVDFLTAGPQNRLYAPLTQKWAHPEGDFFPGLTALVLAAVAILRLRRLGLPPERREPAPRRALVGRMLDGAAGAGLALAAAAVVLHRESFGPVRVRDPGRIVAIAGAIFLVRLAVAFPGWARTRYAGLSDFARRSRLGSRPLLFVWIAGLGVLIALGTHTPFYRFLVQSAGQVFRAIRVPGRGIVLFDLALGVLAAWGLSLVTAGKSRPRRLAWVAGALLLLTFEYRAFPIEIGDVPERAAPVYRWLAGVPVAGGVVEWPVHIDYEAEHVFRSTEHWKPIVNGYSGFAPPAYDRLSQLLTESPIPDSVWSVQRQMGASLLILHTQETSAGRGAKSYLEAARRGLRDGHLLPVAVFPRPAPPGGDGTADTPDLVFRLAGGPAFPAPAPVANALPSPESAIALLSSVEARLTAPFGVIARPREGEAVSAGFWSFGWALDDSGIGRVTLDIDGGAPVECQVHGQFPGVAAVYPGYPDSDRPGFGCGVPAVSPGPHVLSIRVTGKDGGTTVLKLPVRGG